MEGVKIPEWQEWDFWAARICRPPGNNTNIIPCVASTSSSSSQLTCTITQAFSAVFWRTQIHLANGCNQVVKWSLGVTVEEYGCIIYIYGKEMNGELKLEEPAGLKIMMRNKSNGCIQSRETVLKPLTSTWFWPNIQNKQLSIPGNFPKQKNAGRVRKELYS